MSKRKRIYRAHPSASFDDERDDYQAPGHTAPLPAGRWPTGAGVFGQGLGSFEFCDNWELCERCDGLGKQLDSTEEKLAAAYATIENLRAENDNLVSEKAHLESVLEDAKRRLELAEERD